MDPHLLKPKDIAEHGEKIYAELYKEAYERDHKGMFVAIDVRTKLAHLGHSPEEALTVARQASPRGLFHLIRVGEAGAYRLSYSAAPNAGTNLDWIFR